MQIVNSRKTNKKTNLGSGKILESRIVVCFEADDGFQTLKGAQQRCSGPGSCAKCLLSQIILKEKLFWYFHIQGCNDENEVDLISDYHAASGDK